MGIVIEDLDAVANVQADHTIPAMRSGQTVKLTAAQLATYVIAIVTDSAPTTLDTLNELAAALGDDPNFATTVTNALAAKASITGAETLTNKTLTTPVLNGPVVNSPQGEAFRAYISGLSLSNNVTDATNDIDIATGSAGSDGTTPVLMTLASALTKRLDASWAVGTGNGGLDTGSIANTTYHVWLIQRSDTGVVDALFSTSATSPTMPTNYDRKRRIGSIVRESAAIRAFVQDGDVFQWSSPPLDVNAASSGSSAVTRTLTVPSGVRVEAMMNVVLQTASATAEVVYISDLSTTDLAPNTGVAPLAQVFTPGNNRGAAPVRCMTNSSSQIRTRLGTGGSTETLRIATIGWRDTRGR